MITQCQSVVWNRFLELVLTRNTASYLQDANALKVDIISKKELIIQTDCQMDNAKL